jgi:hypothetical protein
LAGRALVPPGAVVGATAGGWDFTRISASFLQIVIAVFRVSTIWQFRGGQIAQSFSIRLHWFIPVSLVGGFTSGLSGASGLLVNPFYLNHGFIREPLLATRIANSLVHPNHQACDLWPTRCPDHRFTEKRRVDRRVRRASQVSGWLSQSRLQLLSNMRFRRLAVFVMPASGGDMLWQQRSELLMLVACRRK